MSIEHGADSTINCFIIAPPGQLSDLLREQLNREGVITLRLDGNDPLWKPSIQVTSTIERSDFVAVILEREPSPNLYVELGLAMGKGKPLLLFSDSSKLPSALSSATTIVTSAIHNDSWKDLRRAFLRTVKPHQTEVKRKAPKKVQSGQRWQKFASEFELLRTNAPDSIGSSFERLIERAFQAANFTISRTPTPDFGADFVLGSPRLIHSFGLPVLIEVKNNSRVPIGPTVIHRLNVLIGDGRAGAALLVITQPLNPAIHLQMEKPIVVATFDELLTWLRNGSFEEKFLSIVDAFWTRPS